MYVTIVHKVHEPEKFWSIAQEALETGAIPADEVSPENAIGLPG